MMREINKTRLKAAPILLLGMFLCAVPSYAQNDEGKLRELYDGNSETAIPILEEKIRSGTPAEKEEALWLFRDQKIINLIPAVIDAVGDPTSLPRHGDTGWGFVAHQAASSLDWLAQSLDGVSLKNRGRDKYSFYDDMYKGGQALKNSGRLSVVKANWAKWWQDYRLKSNKARVKQSKGVKSCLLPASVDLLMDDFIQENSHIWEKVYRRRNKKVIGTILRFSFMATSEARNLLVYSSQWGLNPRIGISEKDERIQRLLVENLKGEKL